MVSDMEMDESVLRHIMDTQTQMLQNLTQLQQDQSRENLQNQQSTIQDRASLLSSNPSGVQNLELQNNRIQTPLPPGISSPVTPPVSQPGLPVNPMAVSDPTQYGTVDALGGRSPNAAVQGSEIASRGLISGTIAEIRDYEPMTHSKEATAEFFTEQTRGIQEQAVDVLGGAASGVASVGSFFIPGGVLPSLLVGGAASIGVGGTTSAISEGARDALDYQKALQRNDYKFINAFESTDEMGGIGMGLGQRQDVSKYLRDLETETYTETDDMLQILEGSSQNGLLKSVSDVKSFKEKFSQIVGAVKEISVTMNASLDEAMQFMGEMERRGVTTRDMPYVAAQTKVMASMAGISTQEAAQAVMQTSDSIVQGTTIDPTVVMESTSENIAYAQQLQDQSKDEDPELYHYIKNQGGAKEVGAQYEQTVRGFVESDQGRSMLLGMFASGFDINEEGNFEINEQKMDELMSSDLSNTELQAQARAFTSQLTPDQLARLEGQAAELFNASADGYDSSQFINRSIQAVRDAAPGQDISDTTAIVEGLGLTSNYSEAEMISAMTEQNSDETTRDMLQSRALKEEMDSNAIVNNPGLFTRARYAWQRNVTNPLGDVGQNVSDALGTGLQDYQKWITGVDDRSMVGGAPLPEFSERGMQEAFGGIETTNEAMDRAAESLRERQDDALERGQYFNYAKYGIQAADIESGKTNLKRVEEVSQQDASQFSGGTLNTYMDRIHRETLSASEVGALAQNRDQMDSWVDRQRADLAIEAAQGNFDTIGGKIDYGVQRAGVEIAGGAATLFNKAIGRDEQKTPDFNFSGADLSQRSLEKTRESLMDTRSDLNDQTMHLFSSGDLGDIDKQDMKKIERAIEQGDTKAVEKLTDNEEARRLAAEYRDVSKDEKQFSKGMDEFTQARRYTKAIATSGDQLGSLLKTAGVYSDAEIDDLLGGIIDRGDDTTKQLKKGKMSTQEMAEATSATMAETDEFFNNMLDVDAEKLAKFLVSRDASAKEQVYEKGSTDVDIEGLQKYVMSELNAQHVTDPEKDKAKGKGTSEDAKKAAEDHEDAMGYFLTTFQNESAMLRDAAEGRPVSKNTSSLSQR